MTKDLAWLKEEIDKLDTEESQRYPHWEAVWKAEVMKLIDQVEQAEKPVIPQFVADWIEYTRKYGGSISKVMNYDNIKAHSHELTLWCYESGCNENLHDLAKAWLYGYSVEKKYRVEDKKYALLCKVDGKNVQEVITTIESTADDLPISILDYELTEQEIKDYDERYWVFAKEVDE